MTGNISFAAAEYNVGEVNGSVTVVFTRTGDMSGAVTIQYEVEPGSATPGADYTPLAGSLILPAGAANVSLTIPILDDALSEATESFAVSLVSIDSGTILFPRTTNITIVDDETPPTDPIEPPLSSRFNVTTTEVLDGLVNPVAVSWLSDGTSRAFIVEKDGILKFADFANGTQSVVLDIRDVVNSNNDRGLLNVVLHPDFAQNHYIYAFYVVDPPGAATAEGGQAADGAGNRFARLVRYQLDMTGAAPTIVPGSETILLGAAGQSFSDISGEGALNFTKPQFGDYLSSSIDPATGTYKQDYIKVDSQSHAGSGMAFGPDGALYVGIGDGASFSYADPRTREVQDLGSLSGKILRIDPLTGEGLADNPFAQAGNLDSNQSKVWSYGLRNPFALTFSDDGRLFISETGWTSWEEINTGGRGANFGWPYFEGGDNGVLLRTPEYRDQGPAAEFYARVDSGDLVITPAHRAFSHANSAPGYQVSAIVGASHVYTGDKYPAVFLNDYFFTDVVDGQVFSVDINDRAKTQFVTDIGDYGPVNFSQGPDGYIYMADLVNGRILRLNIADVPNQVPVAGDDTLLVSSDTVMTIAAGVLFANDSDGNHDALAITATTGLATLQPDGSITLTTGAPGSAQFDYTESDGYGGSDTASVGVTIVATTAGPDTLTVLTPAGGYSFIDGKDGNDNMTGGPGADTLYGGLGEDTLNGAGGADRMLGGAGNDTMTVNSNGDVVIEAPDAGIDTVFSSVDFALPANVENLTMTRLGARGTGNVLGNVINGNAVDNTINGLGGDDTILGGDGNDTIDGGTGMDTLNGGAGNDTYLNPTGDIVADLAGAANGAHDIVLSNVSYNLANALYVEDLTLTGTANINAIGGNANNRLTGNTGNNTLNGGGGNDFLAGLAGADKLNGGAGNDIYLNPETIDVITEAAGAAGGVHDRIQTLYSFNISTVSNVEDITLVGAANANAIGNNLANILIGNAGKNIINGGGGADTIAGGGGNDTMNGGSGADLFKFAAANAGNDRIDAFSTAQDRFDLAGGSFSNAVESAGGTTLTHSGGTILVTGVTGLGVEDWNALVASGARTIDVPYDGATHAIHAPLGLYHFGSPDFLFP